MVRFQENQQHLHSVTELRGTSTGNLSFVSASDTTTSPNCDESRGILRSTATSISEFRNTGRNPYVSGGRTSNPTGAIRRPPAIAPAHIASTRGQNWGWEYAALALSVVALSALLAFLAYINNMRLSHWKFPVSPTAVVSIFAAIARAPLGFAISSCLAQAKWNWFKKRPDSLVTFDRLDDASRGPWGSLWLVLSFKARHMVAVGAAATVLMLAFDPFLQAVISLTGSITSSEGTVPAYLSRSESLDAGRYFVDTSYAMGDFGTGFSSNVPAWFHPASFVPDLGFLSALYNGFYNSQAAGMQTTSATCPTANYSWTPFTTLAICSECHDITSYIERVIDDPWDSWIGWARLEILNGDFSIPAPLSGAGNMAMYATRLENRQQTLSFKTLTTMITAIEVIRVWEDIQKGVVITNVNATECVLYFCVNAYESSMKQGKLEEVLIGSWSERDPGSYADISGEGDSHGTQLFDEWNNFSFYSPQRVDTIRSDLRLLIPESEIQRLDLPANVTTSFNITANAVGSLVSYVNEEFFTYNMSWPPKYISQSPVAAQALASSPNLSGTFNNGARSLTNWMRDTSNTPHRGETQEWATTVGIEWQYVTAPLAAFVAGVLFCLFIFWETGRLGLPPWKTGMIATLTHSLDATTREQLRDASRDGSLDRVAKATVVQLVDAGRGLEMKVKRV